MEFDRKKKVAVAVAIATVLVLVIVLIAFNTVTQEKPVTEATLDDLLSSQSERIGEAPTAAVSGDDPMYAMAATPVCLYYDSSRTLHNSPMLIYMEQPQMITSPANDFLDHYAESELIAVGDPHGLSSPASKNFDGAAKYVSIALAKEYWASADGAVLIKNNEAGYQNAISVMTLSCYVNIPVIICDSVDSDVRLCLASLGVKYTIVCGDMAGFGKVMRLETPVEAEDMNLAFITNAEGFNTQSKYITIANPVDAYPPECTLVDHQDYTGEVFHIYTPGPGAYAGLEEAGNGVDFPYEVPHDTKNGMIRGKLSFKPHEQDDIDGERMYVFCFYECPEEGWVQKFYFGTCGGVKQAGYEVVMFDIPVLGATGNWKFHIEGRNTYDIGFGNLITKKPVPFDFSITLESMDSPVYPNMESLSSIAPYQCAFHQGIVMADPAYAAQHPKLGNHSHAFDPTVFEHAHEYVNNQTWKIHDDELVLLAKMQGWESPETVPKEEARIVELSEILYEDPVYVCVVADTNVIPHLYHEGDTHGGASEGHGQPGDLIFSDVDMRHDDSFKDYGTGVESADIQDYELPEGRIVGYDAMDASALMCRCIYYRDIIDNYQGHDQDSNQEWKDNCYVFLGSKLPVETMYGTYIQHVTDFMQKADFDVIGTTEERSDYKFAHQYQEGSNYVLGGVHGNFYWYVPQCHSYTLSGGSAYDVTNTLEMSMGPSTMFLVSCITGRIDGLAPENALSMAYIHVGAAAYVGATRSTLGWITPDNEFDWRMFEPEGAVLMSEYFAQFLLEDQDVGMALRNCKNKYLPHDLGSGGIRADSYIMVQHYMLYGDPALNPYEPANG